MDLSLKPLQVMVWVALSLLFSVESVEVSIQRLLMSELTSLVKSSLDYQKTALKTLLPSLIMSVITLVTLQV